MITTNLAEILARSDVWRGGAVAAAGEAGIASGFPVLDAALPAGGWPTSGLVELLCPRPGIGELSLLLPALAGLTAQGGWLVVVDPPGQLLAPALRAAGIDLARLLVVRTVRADDRQWACEQLLRAGCVDALLAWLPATLPAQGLRRLQLAAEAGHALAFLFRPAACARQSSPAPLRLALGARGRELQVNVFKRRGAPLPHPLSLAVARPAERASHVVAGPGVSPSVARSAPRPLPA